MARSVALFVAIAWTQLPLLNRAVLAAPVRPDPFVLTQPDGTGFSGVRGGDERLNWISVGGRLVEKGPDEFWRYVTIDGGVQQLQRLAGGAGRGAEGGGDRRGRRGAVAGGQAGGGDRWSGGAQGGQDIVDHRVAADGAATGDSGGVFGQDAEYERG